MNIICIIRFSLWLFWSLCRIKIKKLIYCGLHVGMVPVCLDQLVFLIGKRRKLCAGRQIPKSSQNILDIIKAAQMHQIISTGLCLSVLPAVNYCLLYTSDAADE